MIKAEMEQTHMLFRTTIQYVVTLLGMKCSMRNIPTHLYNRLQLL